MAQQVRKYWIRLKDNFCLDDLLTKSNHTKIYTYKGEERTFGTPCIYNYYLRKADNLYLKVSREIDETMASGR